VLSSLSLVVPNFNIPEARSLKNVAQRIAARNVTQVAISPL